MEYIEIGTCKLYCGDCLQIMPQLGMVDMIFADLPYSTTYAQWDKLIPTDKLWACYKQIIKDKGAVLLTASQPFTSLMVVSNLPWFRCEWIWNKKNPTNFANAKRQPLKIHESVLVFANGQTTYNPQKVPGPKNHKQGKSIKNISETRLISGRAEDDLSGMKYPQSIQEFPKHSSQCGLHPCQKPLSLLEYFIKTYSNPDELVLDNCMGSGSTAVAAMKTGRRFVGIENDPKYFEVAVDRIKKCT